MSFFTYSAHEMAPSHTVRFCVSEKDWSRLQARLAMPAQKNSGIEKLFSQPSVFGCETPIKDSPG